MAPDAASTRLRIIIVGAGMGGLSTAFALSAKGHDVTVLEAAEQLMTAGAGIQVPPVSTRTLRNWGLEKEFERYITIPRTFVYRNYRTGEHMGAIPLNPQCEKWYGAPWWTMHRADYQKILYEAAISKGTKVRLGCSVTSVDCEKPSVLVNENGESKNYEADIIIGADGLRSKVRGEVLGDASPDVQPSKVCGYRALVPIKDMSSEPLLSPLMEPQNQDVTVWIGSEHGILAYPIRQGGEALYNLVLIHPEKDIHTQTNLPDRFPRPASIAEVGAHYTEFGPEVQKLMSVLIPEGGSQYIISQLGSSMKDGILEWRFSHIPPPPTYLARSKKVLLVGDAGHAQFPWMSGGAAMAVEDGAALAECLDPSRLAKHSLSELLVAFEQLRKPRNDSMQKTSSADGPTWNLPKGPKQERRDELLKFLDSEDREACVKAMLALKEEGVGQLEFADPLWMEWAWGYDVAKEMNKYLDEMSLAN